ncbi:MAG: cell division protein FtsQ/DivIB [Rhizobiaceae bacterium]|nr:cell division protein FtsQ/DivIB [Rhizobiaceae bacterium]
MVYPRFLRRPARFLSRIFAGEVEAPRYAGVLLAGSLFAATAIYGVAIGGHIPSILSNVTARTGFAVNDIRISGHRETSEIDVLGQVDLSGFTSLIGMDAGQVRADVEQLPWVESARVRKVYPNALEIIIEERAPFAIWQHGEVLSVIQADGRVIAPFTNERNASLPLVVGSGAPERAADFVATVSRFPHLAKRVTAYTLVAKRRWDLRLNDGATIKLPESNAADAMAELVALDREQALLARGAVSIDMRLADRIGIELPTEGADVFRASMREQLGMSKRPGQRT